jgi:NCS1 family nucleobase:cation symporter-1
LLAFFVPWSAISLTDVYLITKGKVDVPALSQPHGRYGRWNWAGMNVVDYWLVCYCAVVVKRNEIG